MKELKARLEKLLEAMTYQGSSIKTAELIAMKCQAYSEIIEMIEYIEEHKQDRLA